jgi:L-lactate dehydrogenase (cytochrome)
VHSPDLVDEMLPPEKKLGQVDPSGTGFYRPVSNSVDVLQPQAIPSLALCLQLKDFEPMARLALPEDVFMYISSSADSNASHQNNISSWSQVTFKPRVLRDVSRCNFSTTMLGQACRLPIFIAPTGLAGLTHPDGEGCFAAGAAMRGIHYCPSTYSSTPHRKIVQRSQDTRGSKPSALFFQLYVNSSQEKTVATIKMAKQLGYKGLFITVDTPRVGNRVEHRRVQTRHDVQSGFVAPTQTAEEEDEARPGNDSKGALSRSLCWKDLSWIRNEWGGPIALKGIQTAADAMLAVEHNVEAIYLSNHGGRQLNDAPSSLETLLEIRMLCPEVLQSCEVYVDGGLTRGGDALKALCLGARAVGIGRPLLYAIGAYGPDGLLHALDSKCIL